MIPAQPPFARTFVIGFRRWRAWNLAPILRAEAGTIVFVRDCRAALARSPRDGDRIIVWGAASPAGLEALIAATGARLVRIEDGFIRSVGLGSDLIAPHSLAFDDRGIYFDATRPSALENLLMTTPDDAALAARAAALRGFIVARGLTKYNVESDTSPTWPNQDCPVVLVPGQVETDASIALGCDAITTNLALLRAVRAARPHAFLVYKPHPDVLARNRRGALAHAAALRVADHVETGASIIACLACADEVHTMTSLSGFDALLRGIRVVTYGAPFYAGWGLTDDRATDHPAFARRTRRITLDQLVAATLLLYPRYWDPAAARFTTAEAALDTLATARDALAQGPAPDRLISGLWRRQQRKIKVLARACLPVLRPIRCLSRRPWASKNHASPFWPRSKPLPERLPSTLDAAALCKMAERGQITGGVLDGPLAFDNAINMAAAARKGHRLAGGGAKRTSCLVPRSRIRQYAGQATDLSRWRGSRGSGAGHKRADRAQQPRRHRAHAPRLLCARRHHGAGANASCDQQGWARYERSARQARPGHRHRQ